MPPFLVGSQGIICRYLSSCKCFNKFTYRVQTLCYWKSEVTVFSKARIIQQNCYRKHILKIGNTIKNKLIHQVKWKLVILKGGAFINFMELFDCNLQCTWGCILKGMRELRGSQKSYSTGLPKYLNNHISSPTRESLHSSPCHHVQQLLVHIAWTNTFKLAQTLKPAQQK